MKIDKAEEIIDNMYQKRMRQMEEKTNEGLIIHLGTKVEFTKEEEASVILLRELQKLKRELEKKDRIIKEMAGHIILMNDSRGLTNEEKIKYFTDMIEREGK